MASKPAARFGSRLTLPLPRSLLARGLLASSRRLCACGTFALARRRGFLGGLLAIGSRPPGARAGSKVRRARFRHIDLIMLRGLLYICERELAFGGRHADDLIEARDGISNVRRIGHWFFTLLWIREHAIGKVGALRQVSMLRVRFPGRSHIYASNRSALPVFY